MSLLVIILNCVHNLNTLYGNKNFEEIMHIVLFVFLQSHNDYMLHIKYRKPQEYGYGKGEYHTRSMVTSGHQPSHGQSVAKPGTHL